MHRLSTIATWSIVVLAIIVFGAAGYVVHASDPVRGGGRALPVPSTEAVNGSEAPGSTPASTPGSTDTAGRGTIAFLGDDWTAGVGASTSGKRFSSLVAASLGLQERNFGVDGTGYAKSSAAGGSYEKRVSDVVASHPDVVVVSGGRNDTSDDTDTLSSAIDTLFTTLHRKLPDATLIAVAPMWGDSDKPAALAPVTSAVQSAVDLVHGHYLKVADPIHGHANYMSDEADPDDTGYAAIAAALTPRIQALLPAA